MRLSALLYSIALHLVLLFFATYWIQSKKKQFELKPTVINLTGFQYNEALNKKDTARPVNPPKQKDEQTKKQNEAPKPKAENLNKTEKEVDKQQVETQNIIVGKKDAQEVVKPAEVAKPAEVLKPADVVKPAEVLKPADVVKPIETPKPIAKPPKKEQASNKTPQKPQKSKKKATAPTNTNTKNANQAKSSPNKKTSKQAGDLNVDDIISSLDKEVAGNEPDIWAAAEPSQAQYPSDFLIAKNTLQSRIEENWNKPMVIQDYPNLKISITITMDINQEIQSISDVILSAPNIPKDIANVIKNSILRAIYSSTPIDFFQIEHYEHWQSIVLIFSY